MIQTSEYCALGHPDRASDFISSYILDAYLREDPDTRYAVECQFKDNRVTLGGEVTSSIRLTPTQYDNLVREALEKVGYTRAYAEKWGLDNVPHPDKLVVDTHLSQQSPDIARGVDADGWGDQGIFWGMATNEREFGHLPRDYWYARALGQRLYHDARAGLLPIGLDIKTQVEVTEGRPTGVIVAAPMLDASPKAAIHAVIDELLRLDAGEVRPSVIINGTGAYVRHASMGDCGTTGRKLAVDFYGGNCRIGGGSPWTKDPSKADLTLNVYARQLALEYVKEHPSCHAVYVSIACCIGQRAIRIVYFDHHNNVICSRTEERPASDIIYLLGLRSPCYAELCHTGLFADVDEAVAGIKPLYRLRR